MSQYNDTPNTETQQRSKGECDNGTTSFFAFLWIIEGITEKVLQFIMPLKSIYSKKTIGFIEQKCIFELYGEVHTIKNLLIDICFDRKTFFS